MSQSTMSQSTMSQSTMSQSTMSRSTTPHSTMCLPYDAVVLAGGTGSRLGGVDKAALEVGRQTLLARVLTAVAAADRCVCVGPARETATTVTWCREQPPGGGPVAALAAAMPYLSAEVAVLLAVDLPLVDAVTVAALVAAVADHDGAVGQDASGRAQPLLAAYRRLALARALASLPTVAGASMRDLTSRLSLCQVPVGLAALDCDTADDLAAARAAAGGGPR